MDEKMKKKIDAMSYEQLLAMVRFAPTGDPLFQGDTGEYILNRMKELRSLPGGDAKHVRASKKIGW